MQRREIKELHRVVYELQDQVKVSQLVISRLKSDMVTFNRDYENLPIPVFYKKKDGNEYRMQYLNHAYVAEFGHAFNYDRFAYFGKTDFDIYPKGIAENYRTYDSIVAYSGNLLDVPEVTIDNKGRTLAIRVLKWREVDGLDTLVYGMVIKKY
jgi:hypothetical protein